MGMRYSCRCMQACKEGVRSCNGQHHAYLTLAFHRMTSTAKQCVLY